ncbi:MAG TPA: Imm53 family immunity protein [Capsulimonadaceae bacterium]
MPQSSIGAPIPLVMSDGHATVVAYYVQDEATGWDGTTVQVMTAETDDELVAVVRFYGCYASFFGPPNDEAFEGHPLASRGLRPYGTFVVAHSSWLRNLERMNSIHQYHSPEMFQPYKHYILSFHDSTFECIAEGYDYEVRQGSIAAQVPHMFETLERRTSTIDDIGPHLDDTSLQTVDDLHKWCAAQCGGVWAYSCGMSIKARGAEGWKVSIDLAGTILESKPFDHKPTAEKHKIGNRTDEGWMECAVHAHKFEALGDSFRLEVILCTFLEWAKTETDWLAIPATETEKADDRQFWHTLGDECGTLRCTAEECQHQRIAESMYCKRHHFEAVKNRDCPY